MCVQLLKQEPHALAVIHHTLEVSTPHLCFPRSLRFNRGSCAGTLGFILAPADFGSMWIKHRCCSCMVVGPLPASLNRLCVTRLHEPPGGPRRPQEAPGDPQEAPEGPRRPQPTRESSHRIHHSLERDCSGRPSSMHMWSPHDIGRESWVWEEQEAL